MIIMAGRPEGNSAGHSYGRDSRHAHAAHSLVVAYDLTKTDPDAVAALRERVPGQILFERATCWTSPVPLEIGPASGPAVLRDIRRHAHIH